eukprot:Phypoly_transcript_02338.p1 GENE.Phypoly_transcript_02338~~Phypoly_transcript_02338.p1  ORF type:complete len:864 (+),score=130.87 Phypoly_transcript_02338:111-2702(+)
MARGKRNIKLASKSSNPTSTTISPKPIYLLNESLQKGKERKSDTCVDINNDANNNKNNDKGSTPTRGTSHNMDTSLNVSMEQNTSCNTVLSTTTTTTTTSLSSPNTSLSSPNTTNDSVEWEGVEWEGGSTTYPFYYTHEHGCQHEHEQYAQEEYQEEAAEEDQEQEENQEAEDTVTTVRHIETHMEDAGSIIVTVPLPKQKAKQVRPRWKKADRDTALQMHKLHQLCYVAYGVLSSDLCDDESVQAIMLSLIPLAVMEKQVAAKSFFTLLATRLHAQFDVVPETTESLLSIQGVLECITEKRAPIPYFTIMYVALARIVAQCLKLPPPRLIVAFTPMSHSPDSSTESDSSKRNESIQETPSKTTPSRNNSCNSKNKKSPNNENNNNNNSKKSNNTCNTNNSNDTNEHSNTTMHFGMWAEVFLSNDWSPIPLHHLSFEGWQYFIAIAPSYVVDVTRRYKPGQITPCPLTKAISVPPSQLLPHPQKANKILHKTQELLEREDNILSVLANQQMPSNLAGFKNHPSYVLKQHLHKYEAIPPTTPILAHFKGSPVYHRSHVQMMHTAEKWLQEGRQVRDKEQPCAFKSARSTSPVGTKSKLKQDDKDDHLQGNTSEHTNQQSSALFGEWQTEIYIPPTMKNGIIPTNSFGNVYMYTPNMVPFGCAHLPYKGIEKVARQLGIASAPALVGWEYKKGHSYPVLNGIVVAEEHAELLHSVYFDEMAKKEQERADKEAQAKAHKAKVEAKKRKISDYVDSTYNQSSNIDSTSASTTKYCASEAMLIDDQSSSDQPSKNGPSAKTQTAKHGVGGRATQDDVQATKKKCRRPNAIQEDHFHVFPSESHVYDEQSHKWLKTCDACGFTVEFEKM